MRLSSMYSNGENQNPLSNQLGQQLMFENESGPTKKHARTVVPDFENGPLLEKVNRRMMLQQSLGAAILPVLFTAETSMPCISTVLANVGSEDERWDASIKKGLDWIAKQQSLSGGWKNASYPVAVTALAATALICSGSTTTQGPY